MTNLIYTVKRFLVMRERKDNQFDIPREMLLGHLLSKPDQDDTGGEVLLGCVRERRKGKRERG
jgi:hypothetical protein